MRADREEIFETRAGACSIVGFSIAIDLMVVIVSDVLYEMVFASKAVYTAMTPAVLAWILWIICAKLF